MKKISVLLLLSCLFLPLGASAGENYGAIAISDSDDEAYGFAYNYSSRSAAESNALSQCGSGCHIEVWFADGCGAVAESDEHVGWGTASTLSEAESAAQRICGRNCRITVSACTD